MIDHLRSQLARDGLVTFTVRVHPGAKQTTIKSVMDDGAIKINIAAAPEHGKANEMLIEFLAKAFDISRMNIEILSGHTSRQKIIRITA